MYIKHEDSLINVNKINSLTLYKKKRTILCKTDSMVYKFEYSTPEETERMFTTIEYSIKRGYGVVYV